MTAEHKKYKLSSVFKKLANEASTGTLVCVNENQLQGRIFFREGQPELARCRNLQGKEAIDLINESLLVSLRFNRDQNLVTLAEGESDISLTSPNAEPPSLQVTETEYESLVDISSLAQLSGDERLEAPLTVETKIIIAEELTEQLGPLAGILVDELDDNTRLIDALNTLSRDIGNLDAAMQFLEKVKERI